MEKLLLPVLFATPLTVDFRRRIFAVLNPSRYRRWQDLRSQTVGDSYSLKPFDEHRAIFVHIPKCAGVSVARALFGGLTGHMTLRQYQIIFSRQEFRGHFKFTFARNPWDRLVSAFHFLKEGGFSEENRRWVAANLESYDDFDSFVRGWLTRRNMMSYWHFVPQYRFICLQGITPAVDFVGRIEKLDEDFEYVRSKLGWGEHLEKLNRGQSRANNYRDYYSQRSRDIVADVYREDVEMLGYRF